MNSRHIEMRYMFVRATIMVLLATVAPAMAQTDFAAFDTQRYVPPETMLQQIRVDGGPGSSGWILTHRNRLTGAETPDEEVESRTVEHPFNNGARSLIAWTITRTKNDRCPERQKAPCPDFVRIVAVPDGFLAVPQEAWVGEGDVLFIYIVPAGMV